MKMILLLTAAVLLDLLIGDPCVHPTPDSRDWLADFLDGKAAAPACSPTTSIVGRCLPEGYWQRSFR